MANVMKIIGDVLLVLYYILEALVLKFIPKRLRYKDVSGETVLITGGGSGLGRLLAVRFAKLGARVVVWDINKEGNEETVRLIKKAGGQAYCYYCNIADRKEVYEVAAKVKQEVGKVTILFNNAGIVTGKKFLDCPDEMIQKTFEVNAIAHCWLCKAFLPDMMSSNHGHIVSIASLAGLGGVVRLTDYCASKFAAVGFEEALSLELAVDGYTGIHSTTVCPFFINTGMFAGADPGFFQFLEPEYVADEIVTAVLTNADQLILPKVFYFLLSLKSIFPSGCFSVVASGLGFSECMNRFYGRNEQKA